MAVDRARAQERMSGELARRAVGSKTGIVNGVRVSEIAGVRQCFQWSSNQVYQRLRRGHISFEGGGLGWELAHSGYHI